MVSRYLRLLYLPYNSPDVRRSHPPYSDPFVPSSTAWRLAWLVCLQVKRYNNTSFQISCCELRTVWTRTSGMLYRVGKSMSSPFNTHSVSLSVKLLHSLMAFNNHYIYTLSTIPFLSLPDNTSLTDPVCIISVAIFWYVIGVPSTSEQMWLPPHTPNPIHAIYEVILWMFSHPVRFQLGLLYSPIVQQSSLPVSGIVNINFVFAYCATKFFTCVWDSKYKLCIRLLCNKVLYLCLG